MAILPFVSQAESIIDGSIHLAGPLSAGDSTSIMTLNEGNADVAVQVYGTVGGSTVAVRGSLIPGQFSNVDDAYGVEMSYTALPKLKPVGPAVQSVQVTVTGGSDVAVFAAVYITKKKR
jgi:hypothetical protein